MSARERLRDIARMWDNVADACDGEPMRLVGREHAEGAAADLRALADRLDTEIEGAQGWYVKRADQALARLDADLAPPQKEPRHE